MYRCTGYPIAVSDMKRCGPRQSHQAARLPASHASTSANQPRLTNWMSCGMEGGPLLPWSSDRVSHRAHQRRKWTAQHGLLIPPLTFSSAFALKRRPRTPERHLRSSDPVVQCYPRVAILFVRLLRASCPRGIGDRHAGYVDVSPPSCDHAGFTLLHLHAVRVMPSD